MIELTEEQRQSLQATENSPAVVETNSSYVLVRKDVYERLKCVLSLDDSDPDEGAAYINEIMAEDDAHDPLLESQQRHQRST